MRLLGLTPHRVIALLAIAIMTSACGGEERTAIDPSPSEAADGERRPSDRLRSACGASGVNERPGHREAQAPTRAHPCAPAVG